MVIVRANTPPHEGDERLSVSDKAEHRNGDHAGGGAEGTVPTSKRAGKNQPYDVGRALRSVYDNTLREEIPDDIKDLLGRLG